MINVVVKNKVTEASAVVRIVFGKANDGELPPFEAGAHIDVKLPSGLLRQYSLCRLQSDPRYYEIAVLKDPQSRGGSEQIHQLEIGESLQISEPKNHFPLVSKDSKSLLIAAGIGVTPLLPMAQTLQCSEAPFEFHYCAKTPQTAAFAAALEQSSFADKMHFHFTGVPQSSGRMNIQQVLSEHVQDSELYVCGPAEFISSVLEHAEAIGWPEERVHREFFSAPLTDLGHEDNTAFQVKLASTGQVLDVAENQAITDVLEENAIFIPVSCCEGVCGTCLTNVIEGEIEHRDVFLSKQERAEGKQMLLCCSRAKNKGDTLVLDL